MLIYRTDHHNRSRMCYSVDFVSVRNSCMETFQSWHVCLHGTFCSHSSHPRVEHVWGGENGESHGSALGSTGRFALSHWSWPLRGKLSMKCYAMLRLMASFSGTRSRKIFTRPVRHLRQFAPDLPRPSGSGSPLTPQRTANSF